MNKINSNKINFQDVDSWNMYAGLYEVIYSEIDFLRQFLQDADVESSVEMELRIRLGLLELIHNTCMIDIFSNVKEMGEKVKKLSPIAHFFSDYLKKLSLFMANPCEKTYHKFSGMNDMLLKELDALVDY